MHSLKSLDCKPLCGAGGIFQILWSLKVVIGCVVVSIQLEQSQVLASPEPQLNPQNQLPYLVEVEHYFFNQILCNDMPFTGTIGKNWKKHYGEALPRPTNWKEAALQLESAA